MIFVFASLKKSLFNEFSFQKRMVGILAVHYQSDTLDGVSHAIIRKNGEIIAVWHDD